MTTKVVVLDSHLDCWAYAYKIKFQLDVEDLVDVLSLSELRLLLNLETKEI